MGINQSNLALTGFDYVVAVTQDSINSALDDYLYEGLEEKTLCFVYNSSNIPTATCFKSFVEQVGTDPFSVPNNTPSTDPRVQALNNAAFAFAIKAKLGLPPGVPPTKLPDIIQLSPGQSAVTYTLLFSEFIGTQLIFGPRGSVTWFNEAQPFGMAWCFSGNVSLDFQASSFANLPPDVQKRLNGLGNQEEFSVQQLYYDLNSSDLEQQFQFVDSPMNSALNTFMTADFINTYWKALGGNEVLGYGAKRIANVSSSGLAVTNLNFFVPNAVGNEAAPLTLNYLCATNNDVLPATTHANFGWNWIEPNEVASYDGAAALNRKTFAGYIGNALASYMKNNCLSPFVRVWLKGAIPKYSWSMTAGQTPTVSIPDSGEVILSVSYEADSKDQAGSDGDLGKMELSTSYSLNASVSGSQITVVQHLVIYVYIKHLATSASGNVVDIQIIDTYSLGIDVNGTLKVDKHPPETTNNSKDPKANDFLNFWADVNKIISDVATWAQSIASTNLQTIPIAAVQNFVFPGGATFTFTDVGFSDGQDLVSHIAYVSTANLNQQQARAEGGKRS